MFRESGDRQSLVTPRETLTTRARVEKTKTTLTSQMQNPLARGVIRVI
jgi:hypothetical protein